ncbi:Response receiver [Globisporangium polare]
MVVVLCMEIALVLGVGFLLLLSSSVAGTFVRSLLKHGAGFDTAGVDGILSASIFLWGVLSVMGWFFQTDRAVLIRELGLLQVSGTSIKVVLAFVAAEALLVSGISWLESSGLVSSHLDPSRHAIFSWENALVSSGAPASALLDTLILAPLKEELFFRGLVFLVVWNRLQLLGSEYSLSYVVYQVGFAWLVGTFLSLRFAISKSLLECVLLHVVNNAFAMAVSKGFVVDFQDPVTRISVLSAVLLQVGGMLHALGQLSQSAPAAPKRQKAT